jgi:hypothetical protein
MYKVAFAITRPTYNSRCIQDLEVYFFDDIDEAEACHSSMASRRLMDTRAYEMHRLNWELLKRWHMVSADREAFNRTYTLCINIAYCHINLVTSRIDQCPTDENPLKTSVSWGSSKSITGNLFTVTLCKHRFYLENDASVVQKKGVMELQEMMGQSYM